MPTLEELALAISGGPVRAELGKDFVPPMRRPNPLWGWQRQQARNPPVMPEAGPTAEGPERTGEFTSGVQFMPPMAPLSFGLENRLGAGMARGRRAQGLTDANPVPRVPPSDHDPVDPEAIDMDREMLGIAPRAAVGGMPPTGTSVAALRSPAGHAMEGDPRRQMEANAEAMKQVIADLRYKKNADARGMVSTRLAGDRAYTPTTIGRMIGGLAPADGTDIKPLSFAGKERLWKSRGEMPPRRLDPTMAAMVAEASPLNTPRPMLPDTSSATEMEAKLAGLPKRADAAKMRLLAASPHLEATLPNASTASGGRIESGGIIGKPNANGVMPGTPINKPLMDAAVANREKVQAERLQRARSMPSRMQQRQNALAQMEQQRMLMNNPQLAMAMMQQGGQNQRSMLEAMMGREALVAQGQQAKDANARMENVARITAAGKPGALAEGKKMLAAPILAAMESGELPHEEGMAQLGKLLSPEPPTSSTPPTPSTGTAGSSGGLLEKLPTSVRKDLTGKTPDQIMQYLRINNPKLTKSERVAITKEFHPQRLGISESSPGGTGIVSGILGHAYAPFYMGGQAMQGKLPRLPISEVNKSLDPWYWMGFPHPTENR